MSNNLMINAAEFYSYVGPVLKYCKAAEAIVDAIGSANLANQTKMVVLESETDGYVQVLVSERCELNLAIVEADLGKSFSEKDLRSLSLSHRGIISVDDKTVVWLFEI